MLKIGYGTIESMEKAYNKLKDKDSVVVVDLSDDRTRGIEHKFKNYISLRIGDTIAQIGLNRMKEMYSDYKAAGFPISGTKYNSNGQEIIGIVGALDLGKGTISEDAASKRGLGSVKLFGNCYSNGVYTLYDIISHWTLMGKDVVFVQHADEYKGNLNVECVCKMMLRILLEQNTSVRFFELNDFTFGANTDNDIIKASGEIMSLLAARYTNDNEADSIATFANIDVNRRLPYATDTTDRFYTYKKMRYDSYVIQPGSVNVSNIKKYSRIIEKMKLFGYTRVSVPNDDRNSIKVIDLQRPYDIDGTPAQIIGAAKCILDASNTNGYETMEINKFIVTNATSGDREIKLINAVGDIDTAQEVMRVVSIISNMHLTESRELRRELNIIMQFLSDKMYYNVNGSWDSLMNDSEYVLNNFGRGMTSKDIFSKITKFQMKREFELLGEKRLDMTANYNLVKQLLIFYGIDSVIYSNDLSNLNQCIDEIMAKKDDTSEIFNELVDIDTALNNLSLNAFAVRFALLGNYEKVVNHTGKELEEQRTFFENLMNDSDKTVYDYEKDDDCKSFVWKMFDKKVFVKAMDDMVCERILKYIKPGFIDRLSNDDLKSLLMSLCRKEEHLNKIASINTNVTSPEDMRDVRGYLYDMIDISLPEAKFSEDLVYPDEATIEDINIRSYESLLMLYRSWFKFMDYYDRPKFKNEYELREIMKEEVMSYKDESVMEMNFNISAYGIIKNTSLSDMLAYSADLGLYTKRDDASTNNGDFKENLLERIGKLMGNKKRNISNINETGTASIAV